jgi:hypothetical protein
MASRISELLNFLFTAKCFYVELCKCTVAIGDVFQVVPGRYSRNNTVSLVMNPPDFLSANPSCLVSEGMTVRVSYHFYFFTIFNKHS